VKAFLESVKPDIVLVEGPPEADGILQWANHEDLKPPVAILCYQPEKPSQSAFYPFATFSPEWQAILYAKNNNIHVRFMDLPIGHSFALELRGKENNITKNDDVNEDKDHILEENKNEEINNAVLFNNVMKYKSATPPKLNSSTLPLANWKKC
jgi:hypothetical protein